MLRIVALGRVPFSDPANFRQFASSETLFKGRGSDSTSQAMSISEDHELRNN